MSAPYYDQKLDAAALKKLLTQQGAQKDAGRSTADQFIYVMRGDSEAMVNKLANGWYRVRLFKGKCAC